MNLPVPITEGFLTHTQAEQLAAISGSLNHAYRVRQLWRTETEMRISVLDDVHHPTPAAKYWQCIREQTVFLEQLALLSFDYRKNRLKLSKAERSYSTALDELDAEEYQITIDECKFAEANIRFVAEDRIREILLWEKLKNELLAQDPTFDHDNVDPHQLVSYTKRFLMRAVHSDTSAMSGGELDNLMGQLRTSIRRCQEVGVLDKALEGLPFTAGEIVSQLIQFNGVPNEKVPVAGPNGVNGASSPNQCKLAG